MSNLLVINASPRGDASAGNMAANIFLEALPESSSADAARFV